MFNSAITSIVFDEEDIRMVAVLEVAPFKEYTKSGKAILGKYSQFPVPA